jgi:hypothetical protein
MKNATYGEENDGTLQFCLLSVAKIMQRCMNTQQHRLTSIISESQEPGHALLQRDDSMQLA